MCPSLALPSRSLGPRAPGTYVTARFLGEMALGGHLVLTAASAQGNFSVQYDDDIVFLSAYAAQTGFQQVLFSTSFVNTSGHFVSLTALPDSSGGQGTWLDFDFVQITDGRCVESDAPFYMATVLMRMRQCKYHHEHCYCHSCTAVGVPVRLFPSCVRYIFTASSMLFVHAINACFKVAQRSGLRNFLRPPLRRTMLQVADSNRSTGLWLMHQPG